MKTWSRTWAEEDLTDSLPAFPSASFFYLEKEEWLGNLDWNWLMALFTMDKLFHTPMSQFLHL